jgi:hypothetical protein
MSDEHTESTPLLPVTVANDRFRLLQAQKRTASRKVASAGVLTEMTALGLFLGLQEAVPDIELPVLLGVCVSIAAIGVAIFFFALLLYGRAKFASNVETLESPLIPALENCRGPFSPGC